MVNEVFGGTPKTTRGTRVLQRSKFNSQPSTFNFQLPPRASRPPPRALRKVLKLRRDRLTSLLPMTMNVPIGFVLLVNPYNPPAQAGRLIRTLNGMFNHPPITCHHDFGKHPQFIEPCPPNVRLVRPHVNTKWGDFSCVAATVQALRLLYAGDYRPEWFVFLSGADYPIKPAGQILEELRTGGFDGYIEHRLFSEGDLAYPPDPDHRAGWKGETWLQQCHRRYCSRRVDVPSLNRYLKFRRRTYWL